MARQYRKNQVKVDLASYIHYWRGIKKVGKTTLFRDLIDKLYNGDLSKGLLISCGNENGFKALDGLFYDIAENWDEIEDITYDLIENKKDNSFEFICFDTVDELIKIAQEEIIRLHKREKGKSPSGFNACFGGYSEPKRRLACLIDNVMTRLSRTGYGLIWIGHTKFKEIEEKDGTRYQLLTSNLNTDYDLIFSAKADINMLINVEKEIDNNHIQSTQRYMWFRSDGFVDAGGRFTDIESKVEFSVENYIKTVENAIKSSIKNADPENYINSKKVEEKEEREKYYSEHKIDLLYTSEKLAEKIKSALLSMGKEQRIEISKKFKSLGIDAKNMENSKIEKLKEALDFINSI